MESLGHLQGVSKQSGSRRAEEVIGADYNNTSRFIVDLIMLMLNHTRFGACVGVFECV